MARAAASGLCSSLRKGHRPPDVRWRPELGAPSNALNNAFLYRALCLPGFPSSRNRHCLSLVDCAVCGLQGTDHVCRWRRPRAPCLVSSHRGTSGSPGGRLQSSGAGRFIPVWLCPCCHRMLSVPYSCAPNAPYSPKRPLLPTPQVNLVIMIEKSQTTDKVMLPPLSRSDGPPNGVGKL